MKGNEIRAMPPSVLIVGATSGIAIQVARKFAASGTRLFLAGLFSAQLGEIADDLRDWGASCVEIFEIDLTEIDRHADLLAAVLAEYGTIDYVLIAHGIHIDQFEAEASVEKALHEWNTNATSTVALLTLLANQFERQRSGVIAVITSVAGDRGLRMLYLYGATKAGVNTFLSGLRARLRPVGVRVITIKPGLVDTPMTADVPKSRLFASSQRVGRDIYTAMTNPKRAPVAGDVLYTPGYWRIITLLIRAIPEPLFERLPELFRR